MRKTIFQLAVICLGACSISACDSGDDSSSVEGNWVRKSSFNGDGRTGAVSFVIGDKAYVGLGYDGDDYLVDFWSYDAEQNNWSSVADFDGVGRTGAVAFAIGDKGYVATGYDGDNELAEVWEYDSTTDTWTELAPFSGSARYQAVAYTIDGKGYLGSGYDGSYLKDFWEFSPETGTWEEVISLKGEKRKAAIAFVIDDYAYVGTGTNNGLYEADFWQMKTSELDWTELTDLDEDDDYDIVRQSAVSFALDGKGYVTLGSIGSNTSTTWEYTPDSDIWEEKTAFEGVGRTGAVSFTINNRSFVALGGSGSSRYEDIWEFIPTDDYDEDD